MGVLSWLGFGDDYKYDYGGGDFGGGGASTKWSDGDIYGKAYHTVKDKYGNTVKYQEGNTTTIWVNGKRMSYEQST